MSTLRLLLIQRAARLQERPALTAPGWQPLAWGAWRNRVEGVGLGLLAPPRPVGAKVHAASGSAWDWAAEVAAACCGLVWEASGEPIGPEVLGGRAFNADTGRGPFHDREADLSADTPFTARLTHGEVLARLQRLNRALGWDHATTLDLPSAALGTPAGRAALWNLLYAGGHARLVSSEADPPRRGWFSRSAPPWVDFSPFEGFWAP